MKKLITFLMLLSVFGIGNVWADNFSWDLSSNSSKEKSATNDIVTISFGGNNLSVQREFMAFKNESTLSISAISGYTITGISFTYVSEYTPKNDSFTADPTGLNTECTSWSGNAQSISIANVTKSNDTRITNVSVTYSAAAAPEYNYTIPVEDLRYSHATYGPTRTGILGDLTLTATGWMSNTNTSTTPYNYTLMLDNSKSSSFTVTSTSANITKVVLIGANGAGTFSDVSTTGTDTYETTDQDQMVWQGTATNSATVSFTTNNARPQVSEIWVFTNSELSGTKQNVVLSFDPASETDVDANITDYQISGRVKATVGGTDNGYFRPDDFSASSIANDANSQVTYNQFHISTGKLGVNTGTPTQDGTATITATFTDNNNPFYNIVGSGSTAGTYSLGVKASNVKTKTITINDMRISKTASTSGLNASNNNLDRTLGGFNFAFTGNEGIKFNNGDYIIQRNNDASNTGVITITPVVNTGKDVTINRVDISTVAGYTTGTVTATGTTGNVDLSGKSSYSFTNVANSTFTLTSVSGNVYLQSFTIYYTESADGALNADNVTPTITFSKNSDDINSGEAYTSPTVTTSPANFDISLANDNTDVATVKTTNWTVAPLVTLSGEIGTANITASAAGSDFFNAAENKTYTVRVASTAASEKWNFTTLNVDNTINADDWTKNGEYYKNALTKDTKFLESNIEGTTTTSTHDKSQIYELRFGRENNSGLTSGNIRLYSSYLTFNNSACVIAIPVSAGDKVLVTFEGSRFDFTNATLQGDESATSISSDAQTTATLVATAAGYVTLKNSSSSVKLYRIQKTTETRGTLGLRDSGSNTYEKNVGTGNTSSTDNHFNHRIAYTPSDGAANPVTYAADASNFTITSSDPSILDVSNAYIPEATFGTSSSFYFNNIIPKAAGTATLTIAFAGNENYLPTSYTSIPYTVYGPLETYLVEAPNQEIQQGQFSHITPKITDEDGNLLGIRLMEGSTDRYTTYVLGEDEEEPDYSTYFDFTYTAATSGTGTDWDKITVDATGKIETEDSSKNPAGVGATRKITVTATPKTAYASAFSSTTTVTTELTVTIIEKTANIQVDFFWDADCKNAITLATETAEATDNTYSEKVNTFNKGIFNGKFPNGRVIYAKPKNEGDAIWFSYAQNGDAAVIPANPSVDKKKRIFQYRRGIPIYIDDNLGSEDYVTVNVVATTYDANTKKYNLRGTVARLKFPDIVSHNRPAQPTYDPISPDANADENKDGRKIMNTSENVVAYGEGASKTNPIGAGTLVYGKFSTGTVYTTEQLINENAVQQGTGSVPVVSTEVAKRRFTSVQIKNYEAANDEGFGGGDYISEQTYTEYWYLYDTDLRLYSNAEKTTAYPTSQNISTSSSTNQPYYKVTWYNKKNYDDPKNYNLGVTQEVNDYTGKITYSIGNTTADRSGATGTTVDASTGIVTAGSAPGWVRVTATYLGGEEHGGKSGEPQYKSTTDESVTYFYVYILDPATHKPTITPQTCNFAGTMTYTVQAPSEWKVRYTTDGSDPSYTNGTEIAAEAKVENTIGSGMTVGQSVTVKAIAYNSDGSVKSAIVSETYTKKNAVPDPIFDPYKDPSYEYNTNELLVQIACAYPGAVIYYTITETGSGSYPDPVIGADNTYKYSGLSKITVTGNKTIKAIAYDPVENMYSNIVTAVYGYSSVMSKPYFQISTDNGASWYGYDTEAQNATEEHCVLNGKMWYNGQTKNITPSTQIRIVDPNPVTGTIYYTVNGIDPADDATTMIYSEGYPFTVGKTTTGKAITILEDAQSPVSTANFTISTATYGNVWEAVNETMTDDTHDGKTYKGIHIGDGFVISTNKDLKVDNTGSTVHKKSIDTSHGGLSTNMYAQEDITATFGGYDLASWEQMEIADAAIGAPIGNIGDYSIKNISNTNIGNGNARDEKNSNYNHIYSYKTEADRANTGSGVKAATTHEKTFKVPAMGDFVRFEPEKDGDLTIWVLQQGALLYEDDTYFIPNVLRIRPVYLVDEQGKSQKVKVVNNVPQMWSSARLSENWTKIQATASTSSWKDSKWIGPGNDDYNTTDAAYVQYIRVSDGELFNTVTADADHIVNKLSEIPSNADKTKYYKKLVNKGPNKTETAAIYQMYKADLDKNYVSVGDPIKPFAIHTGATISLNDNRLKDDSDDGTGYVLASGGYAKYTFEVKAGKTYFFFAQGSKIGIRGFQFVPTETGTRPEVSMDKTATNVTVDNVGKTLDEAISACAGKTVNVTLSNRNFTTNWTTLVLPFSVSVAQIEKVFGAKTDIVIFDNITGDTYNTIHMTRHWHKMIVAGTPVLIKPTTAVENPKFEGVQLEASTVDEITGSCEDYTWTGTLVKATGALHPNDWYVNTSGKFTYLTGNANVDVNGSYAWLKLNSGAPARMLTTEMGSIIDENSGETTGIIDIELPTDSGNVNIINYDTNVYSINGQIVSRGSLKNLPKGIYIVNGKKVVVK